MKQKTREYKKKEKIARHRQIIFTMVVYKPIQIDVNSEILIQYMQCT